MGRIILNLKHLVERAQQRFGQDCTQAEKHFDKLKDILERNSPVDWRFTTSPSATFILSFQPTEDLDYRVVGRSFRDHKNEGKEIIKLLKKSRLTREELYQISNQYLGLLHCPDCEIFHELKTIYRKGQDISEEKTLFLGIIGSLRQIVPLGGKRVAIRPNAIITPQDGIWVRQGEYLDQSQESGGSYKELLLFQKLQKCGVDKSTWRIYSLDTQGNIKLVKGSQGRKEAKVDKPQIDKGLRSQSYWILPTYVDHVYMDLCYVRSHFLEESRSIGDTPIGLTQETAFLFERLEMLRCVVKEIIK